MKNEQNLYLLEACVLVLLSCCVTDGVLVHATMRQTPMKNEQNLQLLEAYVLVLLSCCVTDSVLGHATMRQHANKAYNKSRHTCDINLQQVLQKHPGSLQGVCMHGGLLMQGQSCCGHLHEGS